MKPIDDQFINESERQMKPISLFRRSALDDLPALLTVGELQEYLNVGRSSAYAFAREHGVRFGKLLRVPKAALMLPTEEKN